MNSILRFVGDPYVDTGVAVLEIRVDKSAADITREDLAQQADQLEKIYAAKAWTGYLTVHFPNSCWCNPTMGVATKQEIKAALLRSFDKEPSLKRLCAYCGRPAQHVADRSSVPLLTGAQTMSTGAGGEPGLPACSACLFAVQFYPLATLKVSGRPLFWWTADHIWMYGLTLAFMGRVSKILEASPDGFANLGWPDTRLFETAEQVLQDFGDRKDVTLVDLIGCHSTNYGSGPEFDEIRIQRSVIKFLRSAKQYPVYQLIRKDAYENPKKNKSDVLADGLEVRRNSFYEDMGRLLRLDSSHNPQAIVHKYFRPHAGKEGLFEITSLFVTEVIGMTKQQVVAIEDLAQQLTSDPDKIKDSLSRLFQRPGQLNFIRALTDISDRRARSGRAPLQMETVLRAFDLTNEDDPIDRSGRLAQELILLKII